MTDATNPTAGADSSAPVAGLTSDVVRDWIGLTESDAAPLATLVPAVNDFVGRLDGVTEGDWTASQVYGALLLAARLYARRNSPAGVQAFTELGASYVSRNDPDVARMLGLDRPTVG